jgi:hypothetical protein
MKIIKSILLAILFFLWLFAAAWYISGPSWNAGKHVASCSGAGCNCFEVLSK